MIKLSLYAFLTALLLGGCADKSTCCKGITLPVISSECTNGYSGAGSANPTCRDKNGNVIELKPANPSSK